MTTDTAMGVTKMVVHDKGTFQLILDFRGYLGLFRVPLDKIPYVVS